MHQNLSKTEKQHFFEQANKIPQANRYFNISVLWIAYFPWVIRALYYLRIPHEVVSLISTCFGVLTAYFIWVADGYLYFIAAAISFHLKDIFDACDGSLARLTKRGHRIGRFFDSLSDFVTITLVFAVVTYFAAFWDPFGTLWFQSFEAFRSQTTCWNMVFIILGGVSILSIFLQCSYFNYYQVKYVHYLEENRLLSRTDETITEADKHIFQNRALQGILLGLQFFYKIVYGWQDRVMAWLDARAKKWAGNPPSQDWYRSNPFLIANSAFVFGTHIWVMILALLMGNPLWSFVVIGIAMNLYWLVVYILRIIHFRKQTVQNG
jgi:hypothetical protein